MKPYTEIEGEIWKDIAGYEGLYQVSNRGNIKRLPKVIIRSNGVKQSFKERKLALPHDKDGYIQISLSHLGITGKYKVHRIVAEAFIGKIDCDKQINHLNGIRDDNRVENIEICTLSENLRHSFRVLGRMPVGAMIENKKPVIAYTIKKRKSQKCEAIADCEFARFDSIADAARHLGLLSPSGISKAIENKTQKTAGGYKWEYA